MTTDKYLIAGNWKMNGLSAALGEAEAVAKGLGRAERARADVVLCPPATLIAAMAERAHGTGLSVGGQDCHPGEAGAHTGDLSAAMLADAGAQWCIVGHSERRTDHGETNELVRAKAQAAQKAGLTPIVCVGETREEREAGQAETVVRRQIGASVPKGDYVLAYEPIWAIGTGLTPTEKDIEAMHAAMRRAVGPGVRLLYGGSVKPANARVILALPNVEGALVGGASLDADDFLGIVHGATPAA